MAPASDEPPRSQRSLRLSIAKRGKGICKKAKELSTLCGVDVCLLCYCPGAATPTVAWPDRAKVDEIIDRYLAVAPSKKMAKNQITFENSKKPSTEAAKDDSIKDDKKADEIGKGKEKVDAGSPWLPCPDDKRALASLVEVLDSRLVKVREKIEMLEPEYASASSGPEVAPHAKKMFDFMQLLEVKEKVEMVEPEGPSSIAGGTYTSAGDLMEARRSFLRRLPHGLITPYALAPVELWATHSSTSAAETGNDHNRRVDA